MRGRVGWLGLAAGVAGLVMSSIGAVPAVADAEPPGPGPLSVAGRAVPLSQSGELVLWGANSFGQTAVPAQYAGVAFSQVLVVENAVLALTADGRVVGWGGNRFRVQQVPAAVAAEKIVQIAYSAAGYVGAVTRGGRVLVWGPKRERPTPLDVPAGLSGVTQLDLHSEQALALKDDGTVVAWGDPTFGLDNVPAGLRAAQIVLSGNTATALTTDGAVRQWGAEFGMRGAPASVDAPGSVKAIARRDNGVLAWLADDSLAIWGWPMAPRALPASVAAADPLLLAGSLGYGFAMVDRDRVIRQWEPGASGEDQEAPQSLLPAGLNGRAISHLALGEDPGGQLKSGGAIVTRMLRADAPRVTGAVRVGSVLSGVPGTFSASPESVVSQWLVNGVPAATGAQLTVTASMVGKSISYGSTATKTGEPSVFSASTAAVVPAPPAPMVPSSTKVVKVKVAKKATKVDVTAKVSASRSPAGKAVVVIKKGKKTIVSKAVSVSAAGSVKLTVKKFGTLVAKKTKAKGKKAKTAYRGSYTVSIRYLGNKQVRPSSHSKKFKAK